MLPGPYSSSRTCSCCVSAGDGSVLQRAQVARPQRPTLRSQSCLAGTGQLHVAPWRHVQYNHSSNSSTFSRHATLNSMRLSAAADGSTSEGTQPSGSQLGADVDAAAAEQVWTLNDLLQEAAADAAQPQEGDLATSDAETNPSSSMYKNSHARRQQQFAERKQKEWQDQQIAKQTAKRREALQPRRQKQQADGSSSNSSSAPAGMPYAYDMSRWQVRRRDWRQGVPNNLDYLVVTPHNAAEKHARYMVRRLLSSSKGRMLLLFHDYKGATKALAILQAATHFLQRKHKCSLLCQVGFTVHDPLRMRLLVTLWPYAGVLHTKPLPATEQSASSSSSTSGTSSSSGAAQQQAVASEVEDSSAAADSYVSGSSSSSPANTSSSSSGRDWMSRCLEGSVPEPQDLPCCCSHLPSLAVPDVVSRNFTLNASRHSEPRKLAQLICSALTLKGRCRVCSAGGIAALHALTAVALSELMLMRSSGGGGSEGFRPQGLAMHIRAVQRREQLPEGSPLESHVVRYYELTLLLCKDVGSKGELLPATCVFCVRRNSSQQQQRGQREGRQQQQQQQRQRLLQEEDDEDEGEGYLW